MNTNLISTIIILVYCSCIATAQDVSPTNSTNATDPFYQDCSITASCFGFPKDCVSRKDCDFFFRSTFFKLKGTFTFELISSPKYEQNTYMAVAFSEENKMSGIVVQCYTWTATNKISIDYSLNSYEKHDNVYIDNSSAVEGFQKPIVEYIDGRLHCHWDVVSTGLVKYTERSYSFSNTSLYLMLAKGKMRTETQVGYHDEDCVISSSPIDLTKVSYIGAGGTPASIRWHGALMIFGWLGCVTVAIIMGRFSRDHYPSRTILGLKLWFQMHRALMIIGWCTIVASYIIIFTYYGGWVGTSFHTVGGLVAGILATCQIFNSFLRPAPDSRNRWIFDYAHWFVGNAAHCLAFANVIRSSVDQSSKFFWLVVSYLLIYLVFSDLLKKIKEKIDNIASRKYQLRGTHEKLTLLLILTLVSIALTLFGLMLQSD